MNTQTTEQTSIHPTVKLPEVKIQYTDLSRGAGIHGIRASVLLETRVLRDFVELDPALGHNVAGVIFAVLMCHLAAGNGMGDDRLSACLIRREDSRLVEADLMLLRRRRAGGEYLYLRLADVRLMPSQSATAALGQY